MDELFEAARSDYEAGRMAKAEATCRRILRTCPTHAGAFHLLGLIARDRPDIAVALLRRAASLKPKRHSYHVSLGEALRLQGNVEAARASFDGRCRSVRAPA